ncbi:SufS family cysteine desulfurase [Sinimarinibacterium sp. CAU 1509]|uniref:aminotransferase class V-fold PLP-dependent enzyme n=1 Tax=Sinimarinibacterium sp. CAU 1509 TaxID=2562283 RepID=UPI0010ACC5EF|nr:SufS family cysteine desulfurase [Sinimarinibacterium sp. CAU 1509]TJY60906.1 SufS family cysteine desulfurase [Sinimarinibacterium sp. CAU 1509]
MSDFDLDRVRADFPILREVIHGKRLAYLDNGATTQKPEAVLLALDGYYRHANANVHRAVHELAARATRGYESARDTIAAWFNAAREEIVFTRGTTDAINLVARSFLQPRIAPGDEVLVTTMEHHSNIVPWQLAGAKTVAAPINDAGELDVDAWRAMLNPRTKLVAVVHCSNSLGTINPIATLIAEAHARGIPVLVDGAQSAAHIAVDVRELDVDFYACSSHKFYGPTGFGVLYAKREHLEAMQPRDGGGDMIDTVAFDGSTWNEIPYKFEAGTPDIAGAIGAAAALDYLAGVGLQAAADHEHAVLAYATEKMSGVPGLRLVGTARQKAGILSFVMDCAHPHDIGSILDQAGVAIRTGHHCTMPLMKRYGLPATARASLALYNGKDDVDQLVDALHMVNRLFA